MVHIGLVRGMAVFIKDYLDKYLFMTSSIEHNTSTHPVIPKKREILSQIA